MAHLFSPLTLKNMTIKNRVVMPPMVCFGWAGDDGFVTDAHVSHYQARARGGVGLIVVEACCVSRDGRLTNSQLGIWADEHIEGLSRLVKALHQYGAKVVLQIHHAGNKTPISIREVPAGPSEQAVGDVQAKAMSIQEIHAVRQDFINAAKRAEKAGFDGVEVHGAHGYIISQFLSPLTNKRQDEYGGSFENRMRLVCEIISGIKKEAGEDFILGYRMGGNEPALEDGIAIARALEQQGVDLLHVSAGIGNDKLPAPPEGFGYNWIVYCGVEVRKNVNIPVIVVNGIRTPEKAAYLIENDMADFAAIGKNLLVDPEWADKAARGESVTACLECKRCSWYSDGRNCPRYKPA